MNENVIYNNSFVIIPCFLKSFHMHRSWDSVTKIKEPGKGAERTSEGKEDDSERMSVLVTG